MLESVSIRSACRFWMPQQACVVWASRWSVVHGCYYYCCGLPARTPFGADAPTSTTTTSASGEASRCSQENKFAAFSASDVFVSQSTAVVDLSSSVVVEVHAPKRISVPLDSSTKVIPKGTALHGAGFHISQFQHRAVSYVQSMESRYSMELET